MNVWEIQNCFFNAQNICFKLLTLIRIIHQLIKYQNLNFQKKTCAFIENTGRNLPDKNVIKRGNNIQKVANFSLFLGPPNFSNLVSISSTLNARFFCMNVILAAFF